MQDPVTLDDFRDKGNLSTAYRTLLTDIGDVTYGGMRFGQVPRAMATGSPYETEPEKQRQEAEHALLGLGLAHDLPAEILAVTDKPDVDVRYADGSLGGVEVVRIMYPSLKQSDSENAKIQKSIREAIASSPSRGVAMRGRHVVVVQSADSTRATRQHIINGVLDWVDQGLPGITGDDTHVQLQDAQSILTDLGVSLRVGPLPGTGWEITVASLAQPVPVLDIVEFVDTWIKSKRRKAEEYRYTTGLRLVMPIVGFHPDPLLADDLRRLREARLDVDPFVRVVVYRDLDCVVLERV